LPLKSTQGKEGCGTISFGSEQFSLVGKENEGKKEVLHFNEVRARAPYPLNIPSYFEIFRVSDVGEILVYKSEVQRAMFFPSLEEFYNSSEDKK